MLRDKGGMLGDGRQKILTMIQFLDRYSNNHTNNNEIMIDKLYILINLSKHFLSTLQKTKTKKKSHVME